MHTAAERAGTADLVPRGTQLVEANLPCFTMFNLRYWDLRYRHAQHSAFCTFTLYILYFSHPLLFSLVSVQSVLVPVPSCRWDQPRGPHGGGWGFELESE